MTRALAAQVQVPLGVGQQSLLNNFSEVQVVTNVIPLLPPETPPPPPQIVQPHHVIRMRMRVDHRLDVVDPIAHALEPKLGRRIDQHVHPAVLEHHRRARAFVVRIPALADLAVAADHRHAGAGAGAEEEEFDVAWRHRSCVIGRIGAPDNLRLVDRRCASAPGLRTAGL